MNIKIFETKNKKEFDEAIDAFSKEAELIYKAREEQVLKELDNDVQKIIFLDWFNGGKLWGKYDEENHRHVRAKRYAHVSDKDWDKAYDYIMETISMGMG